MEKARILIAEDEGIVALDLSMQLQALGFLVVATVRSGEEAVDQAIRTHPDLIMMDVRLKGNMDGIEAAAAIVDRLDIPVVFVSALADKDTIERAKSVRHAGHVVKPFSRQKMIAAIEDALGTGIA
jgi:CheY-like chemotaxis protein